VGYCGGTTSNPTYRKVCGDPAYNDWAECVQVDFDETELSYEDLCRHFLKSHEPSVSGSSRQYQSFIFAHGEKQFEAASKVINGGSFRQSVSTAVEHATDFYEAELYHQKWLLQKSPWFRRLKIMQSRDLVEGKAASKFNAFVGGYVSATEMRLYTAQWVEEGAIEQETYERLGLYLDKS